MHLVFDTKEQGGFRYTMLDTMSGQAIQLQLNEDARHLFKESQVTSYQDLGDIVDFYNLPTILHDFLLAKFNIKKLQVAQAYRNAHTFDIRQISYSTCVDAVKGCFKPVVHLDNATYELAYVSWLKN